MNLLSSGLKKLSLTARNLRSKKMLFFFLLLGLIIAPTVLASESGHEAAEAGHGSEAAITFLWIAVILIAAKISSLVEKIGQPSVLGELIIGVILGNLALLGLHIFEPIKSNSIISFLSELGVVILLFQIGLESIIHEMKKVGLKAALVAIVGVVSPFVLGTYVVGPWLLPGLTSHAYLFLGATLTATSVGITARVFKDLKKLQTKEAQIVLGAAVIDDVLGLIILAVVSAIVVAGSVSVGTISLITGKAILFLVGSIIVGQLLAPMLSKIFAKINTGVAMKFTLVICFGLIFAFLAQLIGLAPIVGAFAAGLILDPVHFRYFKDPKVVRDIKKAIESVECERSIKDKIEETIEPHAHRHIEDLIEPLGNFLIPIFFVMTGMSVKIDTMFDLKVLSLAIGITIAAFVGKIAAGYVAGKGINKAIVGIGMIPRGEVGLIFAVIGKGLGVVDDKIFSIIVIMVILTTLIPPPVLTIMLRKMDKK